MQQQVDSFTDLRSSIALQRARAGDLLGTARHASMKERVVLALRDLAEAEEWLRLEESDSTTFIQIAHGAIRLARWRMDFVDESLRKRGPDATIVFS